MNNLKSLIFYSFISFAFAFGLAPQSGSLLGVCQSDPSASPSCPTVLQDFQPGFQHIYSFLQTGSTSWGARMLENCWSIATRFDEVCFQDPITWTENPLDQTYWLFIFYSLRPLRHLLVSYRETGDIAYREKIFELIISFEAAEATSPYIHSNTDAHGAGFRLLVLGEVYHEFDGSMTLTEINAIESIVLKTQAFLLESNNWRYWHNQGFNQASGVFGGAILFPWLPDSLSWDLIGRERLQYMMAESVDADGVMIESCPFYHNYILMLMSDVYTWGDTFGVTMPAAVADLPLMLNYATDFSYPGTLEMPLVGASISSNFITHNSFEKLEYLNPRLKYLRSGGVEGDSMVADNEAMYGNLYPISGHAIFRSAWTVRQNVAHFYVDAGLFRTEHSDLDLFTFTWFRDREILIDPGLFTLYDGLERTYFQGSSAHNVLVVDGKDQPREYTYSQPQIFVEHDWAGLIAHVDIEDWRWTRAWVFFGDNDFMVFDDVTGASDHSYEFFWHFPSDVMLFEHGNRFNVSDDNGRLARLDSFSSGTLENRIVWGETDPFQGWVSSAYQVMEAAPVISQKVSSPTTSSQRLSFWTVKDHSTVQPVGLGSDQVEVTMSMQDHSDFQVSFSKTDGVWGFSVGAFTKTYTPPTAAFEAPGATDGVAEETPEQIESSDPFCETGIQRSSYCCHIDCGSCGGSGCGSRPGGSQNCCSGSIRNSGRTCDKFLPPCKIVPIPNDPTCANGILSSGYCCPLDCGSCGGDGCSLRPGGWGSCCSGGIEASGRTCDLYDAPCKMLGYEEEVPEENPGDASDPYCESGIVRSDYCCHADCGSCGGDGCSARIGGWSNCCSGGIRDSGRTCDLYVAPCRIVPVATSAPTPAPPVGGDPTCSNGITGADGYCCHIDCGECGLSDCSSRPGGYSSCCNSGIEASGRMCTDVQPPCKM